MKNKFLIMGLLALTICRSVFAISPTHAENIKPIIDAYLGGANVSHFFNEDEEPTPVYSLLAADGSYTPGFNFSEQEAPKGSIGVMNISGPIMKDDYCGSLGTTSMSALFKEIHNNKGVGAILIIQDSPGGELAGTPQFASVINAATKPVIAHIQDLSASAGYWLASAANEVYSSSLSDEVGSIGVYCRVRNVAKAMKKRGILEFEVYAPQSTNKNAAYNDAKDGNFEKLQAELKVHADNFINAVKKHRGAKIKDENVFTGGMYIGTAAIDAGLIDGIMTFDEVKARAYKLANSRTIKVIK